MHICFVLDEFWPSAGGIATFYRMLSRLLVEAGHRVTILLDDRSQAEQAALPDEDYEVIRLSERVAHLEKQLWKVFFDEVSLSCRGLALGAVAREWYLAEGKSLGIDVIEVADTKGYGLLLADERLPPLVLACHGSMALLDRHQPLQEPNQITNRNLQIACELSLTGLADTLVAHSPMNAEEWKEITERPVRMVRPPWHPLDGAFYATDDRSYDAQLPLSGLVVGRLERRKGPLEVAQACRICNEQQIPVELNWLGRSVFSAPDHSDMSSYLEKNFSDVWNSSFHWHGETERAETIRQIRSADYLLVASTWETLNLTVFEAMACGTPVIVSEGAGAHGFCQHEVDALCVPAGDPEAIAKAIQRLTADPELRARLGRAGVETVKRELAAERVVGDRIDAYQAAIQRRTARKQLLRQFAPCQPMIEQVIKAFERSEMRAIDKLSFPKLLQKMAGKLKRAVMQKF